MSILNRFTKFFHEIKVYSLATTTGAWGTSEKETYTLSQTIQGYIQPVSGSESFKNESLDNVKTHRMYIPVSITLNDTDKITYNGDNFHITYNQKNGVANIGSHKEIGLTVLR